MALTFPANPTVGQTYTSNDYTYSFDGDKWTSVKRQVTNVFNTINHLKAHTALRAGDWCKTITPISEYTIASTGPIPLANGLFATEITRDTGAVLKFLGYRLAGYFGTITTLTSEDEVMIDNNDDIWKYVGVGAPSKVVAASVTPSAPDFEKLTLRNSPVIVADTTNGNSYKIVTVNGVLTAVLEP